jgi:hypothetical protein
MATKSHGEVQQINGKRVASPEYRSWQMMKNRCLNPNAMDYMYYGGRGIKVCDAWLDFNNFISDMGRRPNNDDTLDRIDSDGGYTKENCHWVSREVQARNRACAKTKSWELANVLGVKITTASHYIWQVRAKDKNKTKGVWITPEIEKIVREHLERITCK